MQGIGIETAKNLALQGIGAITVSEQCAQASVQPSEQSELLLLNNVMFFCRS
jgi:hypothetical protein